MLFPFGGSGFPPVGDERISVQVRPIADDFPLHFDDWRGVLATVAYAPLLLWGPILAALTVACYRRRR
ncbi:hypothetical protein GCM10010182_75070 [Actinomadura cremea]|nr:hypothetical protein GCM10010182_75070 [Actinomadura cremea]